jgi:DNA-directed RNA polymerase subunit N (RpoN/RPB10)
VRKLQRGSGKYKGMFPFKCFNCGKIGHFASKFHTKKTMLMKKKKKERINLEEITRKNFLRRKYFTQKRIVIAPQMLKKNMNLMQAR